MHSPQASQWNTRTDRGSLAFTVPQAEQVLDDGYQRSAVTSADPYHRHFYVSWRRSSANPTSVIARARRRLRTIPATFNRSTTIVS
jgi:hypothetical protein